MVSKLDARKSDLLVVGCHRIRVPSGAKLPIFCAAKQGFTPPFCGNAALFCGQLALICAPKCARLVDGRDTKKQRYY